MPPTSRRWRNSTAPARSRRRGCVGHTRVLGSGTFCGHLARNSRSRNDRFGATRPERAEKTGPEQNSVLEAYSCETRFESTISAEYTSVKVMLVTHVDDIMWASKAGYAHMVDGLLETYTDSVDERSCCLRASRDSSLVAIPPRLSLSPSKSRKRGDDATPADIAQLYSVFGSVGWVAHQCRPDLSHQVSKLQTSIGTAKASAQFDGSRLCDGIPMDGNALPEWTL